MRTPGFITLALLACLAAPAAAQCPESRFLYGGPEPAIPIVKVAPQCDTTFASQFSGGLPCDQLHGRYHVGAGYVLARVPFACNMSQVGGGVSGIETAVEDDFTVLGVPPGTPVSLTAQLHVVGHIESFSEPGGGGGGVVRGAIREGTSTEVFVLRGTSPTTPLVDVDESIAAPLSAVGGTTFRLRFAVRAAAFDGIASLEGRWSFAGLPAGARIESCRGYMSEAVVPAGRTTWGALKLRYR